MHADSIRVSGPQESSVTRYIDYVCFAPEEVLFPFRDAA